MEKDIPVFDRRHMLPAIVDKGEWAPRRIRIKSTGVTVRMPGDPPPSKPMEDLGAHDLDMWIRNATAWYSSQWTSGQEANDNTDWPLQKLLRTEKNEHCLDLAIRYRDLHDTAMAPTQLIGREPEDLYDVQNRDKEGRWKGPKIVNNKRVNPAVPTQRAVASTEETKKRAATVPKKWNGDWPILAAIDAKRELAFIRAKLVYVPAILDAFEWSVVDGETLEEIGKRLGAGSKGAKGEARARIFDGFGIVDRYWRRQERVAA
ncbi:hypothetical protein [Shinella oryzae]|uniref:Uncharacterized protein n=1 Tax=Shinella oryzae TaxID=2871820 RepID=A0ABY9K5E8_9HYPH|nr:hypothetical protein [Shinella oryzae]WLS03108.1 hypothetical protein Q9315_00225 [Shinella oryzae]